MLASVDSCHDFHWSTFYTVSVYNIQLNNYWWGFRDILLILLSLSSLFLLLEKENNKPCLWGSCCLTISLSVCVSLQGHSTPAAVVTAESVLDVKCDMLACTMLCVCLTAPPSGCKCICIAYINTCWIFLTVQKFCLLYHHFASDQLMSHQHY